MSVTVSDPHTTLALARRARTGRLAWWLHGLSPAAFIGLWKVFDLSLVVGTGALSAWLRFGELQLSGPRGMAIGLAGGIAWFAFEHVARHASRPPTRRLPRLRRAPMELIIPFPVIPPTGFPPKRADSSR